jgi:hypothetical protein
MKELNFLLQYVMKIYSLERDLVAAEEGALIWKQAAAKEVKSGALMRDELERCQEQVSSAEKSSSFIDKRMYIINSERNMELLL